MKPNICLNSKRDKHFRDLGIQLRSKSQIWLVNKEPDSDKSPTSLALSIDNFLPIFKLALDRIQKMP
jgi:hypothetical protein